MQSSVFGYKNCKILETLSTFMPLIFQLCVTKLNFTSVFLTKTYQNSAVSKLPLCLQILDVAREHEAGHL